MIGCDLNMAKQQLPDTPWHIGYTKMKESDDRRLNKWCVHYDASICRCPKSGCYKLRCGGSSHCKFYAVDANTSKKLERDNRTQAEIEAENRRKYIASLQPRIKELVSSLDDKRYNSVKSLKSCYVCGSKLLQLGEYRKQCTLCHTEYVDQVSWLMDSNVTEGEFVYVMGREKPAKTQKEQKPQKVNKPSSPVKAPTFQRTISTGMHLEVTKFAGVKNIPMSSISFGNGTIPKQSTVDRAAAAIRRDGGVTIPIYIGICGDKYLLKEGHVRYLAARQCKLYSIPATFERELSKGK